MWFLPAKYRMPERVNPSFHQEHRLNEQWEDLGATELLLLIVQCASSDLLR